MLPYVALPHLGPITAFGVLAMLGVYVGLAAGSRHAEKLGLDPARVRRMAICCGVGGILGVVAIGYAVPRFFLDFLRRELTDPRYAGFTPAQWSCLATVAAAIALFAWIYRHREPPPARYLDATPGASTSATSSGSAVAPPRPRSRLIAAFPVDSRPLPR